MGRHRANAKVHAAAKPNESIAGTWQGTLHPPHRSLRIALKVKKTAAGRLTAKFYSIDQGGRPKLVTSIRFKDGVFDFALGMFDIKYTGKMSADRTSITGAQTQMSRSVPLVFERATPETAWIIPPSRRHVAPMATTANPSIEVSTVKLTKPGTRMTYLLWRGNQLVSSNFTLRDLILFAYNVQQKQVNGGPSWIDSEKLDIRAKPNVPGTPNQKQIRDLVKNLLADRFHLKIHDAYKRMSAYVLTVAKSGVKMTKNSNNSAKPRLMLGPPIMTLHGYDATMDALISLMQAHVLDRPVVNHTGLTGHRDFSLHWTPDATQFDGRRMPAPSKSAPAAPPLTAAFRKQLGLNLRVEKTSVPVLVIDHVSHPSPN